MIMINDGQLMFMGNGALCYLSVCVWPSHSEERSGHETMAAMARGHTAALLCPAHPCAHNISFEHCYKLHMKIFV